MRFLDEVFDWLGVIFFIILLIILFVTAIVWVPIFVVLVVRWATKLLFFMQTKFGHWFTFGELEENTGIRGSCLQIALASLGGDQENAYIIRRIKPDLLDQMLEKFGEEKVKELEEAGSWFVSPKDSADIWEFSLIRKSGGKRKLFPKTVFTKWKPQHA